MNEDDVTTEFVLQLLGANVVEVAKLRLRNARLEQALIAASAPSPTPASTPAAPSTT
jgi:hypothetical protein